MAHGVCRTAKEALGRRSGAVSSCLTQGETRYTSSAVGGRQRRSSGLRRDSEVQGSGSRWGFCCSAEVAGCGEELEVTLLSDGCSVAGSEVEASQQWQLAESAEGPGLYFSPGAAITAEKCSM